MDPNGTDVKNFHSGFIYSGLSLVIAGVFTLAASILTFHNIGMHLLNYSRPRLQKPVVSSLAIDFLQLYAVPLRCREDER